MFRDVDDFNQHRTPETAIDIEQYRTLLRWLTFAAMQGDHYESFALPSVPQATWQTRRSEDDILLGIDAFPMLTERGRTHIQLFGEGHPIYSSLGINAIAGTRDDEGYLQLWILSTDGDSAWLNDLHTGESIDPAGLDALITDFQEVGT